MSQYVCTVHLEINVDLDVTADNYGLAEEVALEQFNKLTLDDLCHLHPFVTRIIKED